MLEKERILIFLTMESSKKITYIVGVYMFLIQLRPLDPYMTPYLTGPNGNITFFEVANSMESIKSYSALLATLIMLIISDYLLYKPVIIFLTCCSFMSYIFMAGFPNLTQLRVAMVFFGSAYSTTLLASCYLFARIDNVQQFQVSASIAITCMELGKFFGDVLGQIIVSTSGGSYATLPYYSAFTMFLAVFWALLFPPIKQRELSKTDMTNENTWLFENSVQITSDTTKTFVKENLYLHHFLRKYYIMVNVFKKTWFDFQISFSNIIILKRSLWYLFGIAAFIQILTNINVLYSYVANKQSNNDVMINGFAESMVTFFGALGAYLIGKVKLDWTYYGDLFTAFCSSIMGFCMISCYFYDHLLFVYLSYILFDLLSEMVLVITLSEMAKHLKSQCYSLVMGFNLFGSLVMSAIMTFFFVQFNFMDITVPGRFLFIGGLYVIMGIMFLIIHLLESDKCKTMY